MYITEKNGPAKIIMNTILAGTAGGISGGILRPILMRTYSKMSRYDISAICNGLLSGLVAITGSVDNVQPWQAVIIGLFGGIVYSLACKLSDYLSVDDPLEASAVHGFAGIWGVIAVGIFDNSKGLISGADDGKLGFFGVQILGAFVIIAWVAIVSGAYFFVMRCNCCCGNKLRVNLIDEVIGLDVAEMGTIMDIRDMVKENEPNDALSRRNTERIERLKSFCDTAKK